MMKLKTDPACASTTTSLDRWKYLLGDYDSYNQITATELAERHEIKMIDDETISIRGIEVELNGPWDERNELKGPFHFSFEQYYGDEIELVIRNTDEALGKDCATLPIINALPLPANNTPAPEAPQVITHKGRRFELHDDGNGNPVPVLVSL